MKNNIKVNMKLNIVVGILIISLFGGGVFAVDETKYPSCELMINTLDLNSNNENESVKLLTQQFCTTISTSRCIHDGDLLDANQSVFLTLLCDNVGKGDLFENNYNEFLIKTGFTQFGIFDYGFLDSNQGSSINFCDYKTNLMNGCNYAEQLPKMFDEIMNDFFNVKQADLYGVDSLEESKTNEQMANNFSKKNFAGLNICDSNDEYYESTCRYLKSYMSDVKNLLKTTTVIDIKKLADRNESDNACDVGLEENILYCGLLGNNITAERAFLNVVYNEYLWYRLFVSYYSYELSTNLSYSEFTDNDSLKKMDWNLDKVYSFREQTYRSREGVTMALRSLSEMSSSFALHVGFLMYQEDAKLFMKKLAKLYPPIRTLYDKLRNVQKP